MIKPEFIDNQKDNTLVAALKGVLDSLPTENVDPVLNQYPDCLRIATAYFNPSGFAQLADEITRIPKVKLLLGVDYSLNRSNERKQPGQPAELFENHLFRNSLDRAEKELRYERDHYPFNRTTATALRRLTDALRFGNIEVRRYEHVFLHAKAYIFTSENEIDTIAGGIISGSSNFTSAGLTRNLELNLGQYDNAVVKRAKHWFDDLWQKAQPFDLVGCFEEAMRLWEPWDIFIRVLWRLYGEDVEEDIATDQNLPLTNFQKHGVTRALKLIRDIGGVIVADEVGLGKTFIAGEILQRYQERRQRALVICPASLRDSTWDQFLNQYQMFAECISFEQLASDVQLRDLHLRPNAKSKQLRNPIEEYQLIIVDEAHNYRNPSAPTRAAALRQLLYGKKRDLLLLTATPVNNSLWDLYHLLRFFLRQDSHLANQGILSIRDLFSLAMREDPANLSPDVLFPVIDATTVKRTRQFVKKHYEKESIRLSNGKLVPIVFPHPVAKSIHYNLDETLPNFFDQLEDALNPDSDSSISFTRYTPDRFRLDQNVEDHQQQNPIGLLRSLLLKRFESSVFAFSESIRRMISEHTTFLEALDAGYVVTTDFLHEWANDDEVEFLELLDTSPQSQPASEYDIAGLQQTVECDRNLLSDLVKQFNQMTPQRDPKLKALVKTLASIVEQAQHESTDNLDESQKRKVIIYTSFKDTVDWIENYLKHELENNSSISHYRNRMVSVSGSSLSADENSRVHVVTGFAPISMGGRAESDADLYDLLITTDVLAEGVNLQQCRNIINFDMPWNPMRLVQRHGRIDRIGSPHNRVYLRTFFPVDRLDQLLNLEQRILNKLAMAAAAIGVVAPIEGSAEGTQVFAETPEEIRKLLQEDASLFEKGGTDSAAQTGEEYRQTLRDVLEMSQIEYVQAMPWKIGSGIVKGNQRGVFFCAVVGDRTFLRFISADSNWQPRSNQNEIVRERGTCLRLIECSTNDPKWEPTFWQEFIYDFWDVAQSDILAEWTYQTDPINLQPRVRPLNRRVAEFIRSYHPTNISSDKIEKALDIVESPWPQRDEKELRIWFSTNEYSGEELARFLIENILNSGLESSNPIAPLPPIVKDEIELFCWLAIEAKDHVVNSEKIVIQSEN